LSRKLGHGLSFIERGLETTEEIKVLDRAEKISKEHGSWER